METKTVKRRITIEMQDLPEIVYDDVNVMLNEEIESMNKRFQDRVTAKMKEKGFINIKAADSEEAEEFKKKLDSLNGMISNKLGFAMFLIELMPKEVQEKAKADLLRAIEKLEKGEKPEHTCFCGNCDK